MILDTKLTRAEVIESLEFAVLELTERTRELKDSHIIEATGEWDSPEPREDFGMCVLHRHRLLLLLNLFRQSGSKRSEVVKPARN